MTRTTQTADPARRWRQGWHPLARVRESPNHDPRPAGSSVTLIVVHSISLPPGKFQGDHVAELFCNQLDWDAHPYFRQIRGLHVSSHFFIRRDGALWQFVSCDQRAWHAGASEFKGRTRCNDFSVGIELEGLEGGEFTAVQYRVLGQVCVDLAAHYPIAAIAGHEHIAPGRKFDPGPGFDWRRLQRTLEWPSERFAPLAAASRQD